MNSLSVWQRAMTLLSLPSPHVRCARFCRSQETAINPMPVPGSNCPVCAVISMVTRQRWVSCLYCHSPVNRADLLEGLADHNNPPPPPPHQLCLTLWWPTTDSSEFPACTRQQWTPGLSHYQPPLHPPTLPPTHQLCWTLWWSSYHRQQWIPCLYQTAINPLPVPLSPPPPPPPTHPSTVLNSLKV